MLNNNLYYLPHHLPLNPGAEQDEAFQEIMTILNECGATTLCFDLIASGIDLDLQLEAVNLLVAMVIFTFTFYLILHDKLLNSFLFSFLFNCIWSISTI